MKPRDIKKIPRERIIKLLVAFLIFLVLFLLLKKMVVLIAFLLLDYLSALFKNTTRIELPVDFLVLGVIFFSYFSFSFLYLGAFLTGLVINRLIFGSITVRHFVKMVVLTVVGLSVWALGSLDFFIAGMIGYVIRIALEYIIMVVLLGEMDIFRVVRQSTQLIFAYLFFFVTQNLGFLVQ
jgi:hypothetical protein